MQQLAHLPGSNRVTKKPVAFIGVLEVMGDVQEKYWIKQMGLIV